MQEKDSVRPMPVRIENTATIRMAANQLATKRRKYIDIKFHYLHQHDVADLIAITQVPSDINVADALTKPCGPILHAEVKDLF